MANQNENTTGKNIKEKPGLQADEDISMFAKLWQWYKARRKRVKEQREKPLTFGETWFSWTKTVLGAIIVVMIINGTLVASFVVPTGSMERTVMTGDFLFVNRFIYGPSTPQVLPFLNIPLPFFKFPAPAAPEKGDVIVFIFPGNRDEVESKEFQYYMKRCVAVAGDSLSIINRRLFVNGKEYRLPVNGMFNYQEPLSPYNKLETFPPSRGYTRDNYGPIRIPKKGDNISLNALNWREWEYFIKKEGHDIQSDGYNVFIDDKLQNSYRVERDYVFGMGDNRDNSLDSRYWGFIPVESVVGTPLFVYWSWPEKVKDVDEKEYKNDPDQERELTFFEKISRVRLNRIAKLIK